ncbi:MAG: transposase [Cognaticolwellia sp.]|jgi:transposase
MRGINFNTQLVQQFHQGNSRVSIVKSLNVSRRLVNEWIAKYLSYGLEGLALKLAICRPSLLNKEQKNQLKAYVVSHVIKEQGGCLPCKRYCIYWILDWRGVGALFCNTPRYSCCRNTNYYTR